MSTETTDVVTVPRELIASAWSLLMQGGGGPCVDRCVDRLGAILGEGPWPGDEPPPTTSAAERMRERCAQWLEHESLERRRAVHNCADLFASEVAQNDVWCDEMLRYAVIIRALPLEEP